MVYYSDNFLQVVNSGYYGEDLKKQLMPLIKSRLSPSDFSFEHPKELYLAIQTHGNGYDFTQDNSTAKFGEVHATLTAIQATNEKFGTTTYHFAGNRSATDATGTIDMSSSDSKSILSSLSTQDLMLLGGGALLIALLLLKK